MVSELTRLRKAAGFLPPAMLLRMPGAALILCLGRQTHGSGNVFIIRAVPSKMAKVAARELYGANIKCRGSRDLRVVVVIDRVVIRASAVIGDFSAENAPRRGKVVVETFPTYSVTLTSDPPLVRVFQFACSPLIQLSPNFIHII